jgi:hypothetical protein
MIWTFLVIWAVVVLFLTAIVLCLALRNRALHRRLQGAQALLSASEKIQAFQQGQLAKAQWALADAVKKEALLTARIRKLNTDLTKHLEVSPRELVHDGPCHCAAPELLPNCVVCGALNVPELECGCEPKHCRHCGGVIAGFAPPRILPEQLLQGASKRVRR